MRYRRATPADADAVQLLAADLATSYRLQPQAFRASFAEVLADPQQAVLLAENHEIVGYVHVLAHQAFHANGYVAWVEELMVAPGEQGRGLGAGLMAEAERWAAALGCAYVCLATRRAAAFYEHLGYSESAAYFRKSLA